METRHKRWADDHHVDSVRTITVELLALDLTSCTRCVGTLDNIRTAIEIMRPVLEATGARVTVREVIIDSEDSARHHQFVSSPTVRINGRDIAFDVRESQCDSCTDLCGCDAGTSCRIWPYRGQEYTEAPVGLVVESLVSEIFGEARESPPTPAFGYVPENLQRFFASRSERETETCCSRSERETCCEPEQKTSCCTNSEPQSCGCR